MKIYTWEIFANGERKCSVSFGCCCVQYKEEDEMKIEAEKEKPWRKMFVVSWNPHGTETEEKKKKEKKIHTSFNSGVDGGKLEHKKKRNNKKYKRNNNMKIITHFELNEHENCKDNDNNNTNNISNQKPTEILLNVFLFTFIECFSFLSRKDISSHVKELLKINGNLSCHLSRWY